MRTHATCRNEYNATAIVAGGPIRSASALQSLAEAICPNGPPLFTISGNGDGDGRPLVWPSSVAEAEAQIIVSNRLNAPLYLYTGDVKGREQPLFSVIAQYGMTLFALRSWVFKDAAGNPIDDRSVFVDVFTPGIGRQNGTLARRYRPTDPFVASLRVPPIEIAADVTKSCARKVAAKSRCARHTTSNVVPLHVYQRTRSGRGDQ